MNKETYQKIMENLQAHTTACKEYLSGINTTADLRTMTIDQIIALRTFARAEQASMDTVAGTELYHIIGMGEMSAVQTNSFIKLIKEYLSYRSLLKTIAMNLVSFDTLPGIPVKSHYDLKVLGKGIRLTTGPDDGFEEQDFEVIASTNNSVIKILNNREFRFKIDEVEEAKAVLSDYGLGINPAELNSQIGNCGQEKNIYGFVWTHVYEDKVHYYMAKSKSDSAKSKMNTMYNNLRGE